MIVDPFKERRSVTHVPVIDQLDPRDVYDYVLVIVRKNQVPALLPLLAQNSSPNIVFMINNPSGPGLFTEALDKKRILLGFVFGAGRREGDIIHGFLPKAKPRNGSPFGELDGSLTPRLARLVDIFNHAGLPAKVSPEISDYLARHAAFVAPLAHVLILHDCDNRAMAHATADLALLVDALRETGDVLDAVGVKTAHDKAVAIIRRTPKFILVAAMRFLLPTRYMEVGAAWHCSQAPDEMHQLGVELMALVDKSGLPAPALHQLFSMDSRAG